MKLVFSAVSTGLAIALYLFSPTAMAKSTTPFDYDGDSQADLVVRDFNNFEQHFLYTGSGNRHGVTFGRHKDDIPISGDFDGDGIYDIAIRRANSQTWYVLNSSGKDPVNNNEDGITRLRFGLHTGDIPVPADYDGDGKTDFAVRRPANHTWYIRNSSGNDPISGHADGISRVKFGLHRDDIPVAADYDGDGKADIAVRRPTNHTWYIRNSNGVDLLTSHKDGVSRVQFGRSHDDVPVVADYDGDGKSDIAVWRSSTNYWYIKNSAGADPLTENRDAISRIEFGENQADIPIVADYDGDGKADIAIRVAGTTTWYINESSSNSNRETSTFYFGVDANHTPLAKPLSLMWRDSDIDSDGLINGEEKRLGTDIAQADSDNDGLLDGDEIHQYNTDPLNNDSDGDGISDGDEIQNGSDPNNANNSENSGDFQFTPTTLENLSFYASYTTEALPSLVTPVADAWQFDNLNSVTLFDNDLTGTSTKHSFKYEIASPRELSLTSENLRQQQVNCFAIPDNIGSLFSENLMAIINAACIAELFENHQITIESGISNSHWKITAQQENRLIVDMADTQTYRLILPDAIKNALDEEIATSIDIPMDTRTESIAYTTTSIMAELLEEGLDGSWVMPIHYLQPIAENSSENITNFAHDRIAVNGHTAEGRLSNKVMRLSHDQNQFQLSEGEQTLVFTPLERKGLSFLVKVEQYMNNEHQFTFVASMSKASSEPLSFFQNPTSELPNAYVFTTNSWKTGDRQDGLIRLQDIDAIQFSADGSVRDNIGYYGVGTKRFIYNTGGHWQKDVETNRISTIRELAGVVTVFEYIEVINATADGKITVFEYGYSGLDSNDDGSITDDEKGQLSFPRLNVLEPIDLSQYGDVWKNTQLQ